MVQSWFSGFSLGGQSLEEIPVDGAAPTPVPVPWDALDDTHELYVRLDAAVEAEDYDEAARIKERIDALLNTGPQLWSIKDGL